MQFNSYLFILLFLPLFLLCYSITSKFSRFTSKIVIILFSMVFYAYGGWSSIFVLIVSLLLNVCFSLLLSKASHFRKLFLCISVISNIALLLYFKYFNFTISTINSLFSTNLPMKDLFLPLGISFFTFQQLMYLLAIYRNEIKNVNLVDYLCYILYFPKLVMGPLMEPSDFIDQLNHNDRNPVNSENLACGLKLFSFGLFKRCSLQMHLQKVFPGDLPIFLRQLLGIFSLLCFSTHLKSILISVDTAIWLLVFPK